jgi:hypothetical protein
MPKRVRGGSAAPSRAKASAPAEESESADIDRILNEKGKGASKKYVSPFPLCIFVTFCQILVLMDGRC